MVRTVLLNTALFVIDLGDILVQNAHKEILTQQLTYHRIFVGTSLYLRPIANILRVSFTSVNVTK